MKVSYQVCYKPNGGSNAISWVKVLPATAAYHLVPWTWRGPTVAVLYDTLPWSVPASFPWHVRLRFGWRPNC